MGIRVQPVNNREKLRAAKKFSRNSNKKSFRTPMLENKTKIFAVGAY
jgi:hypothetical protein